MASPIDNAKSPSTSPKGKEKSPSVSPRHSPSQSAGPMTPLAGLVAGDADNPVPVQVDVSTAIIDRSPLRVSNYMRDVMQHVESLFVMDKKERKKVNEEEEEPKGNEKTLKIAVAQPLT